MIWSRLFRKSGNVIARVNFGFHDDFELTFRLSIRLDGTLPQGLENWIWDLFYAKSLYTLGRTNISESVRAQLETWAEEHVSPLLAGFPVPLELPFTIDPDIVIGQIGYP